MVRRVEYGVSMGLRHHESSMLCHGHAWLGIRSRSKTIAIDHFLWFFIRKYGHCILCDIRGSYWSPPDVCISLQFWLVSEQNSCLTQHCSTNWLVSCWCYHRWPCSHCCSRWTYLYCCRNNHYSSGCSHHRSFWASFDHDCRTLRLVRLLRYILNHLWRDGQICGQSFTCQSHRNNSIGWCCAYVSCRSVRF